MNYYYYYYSREADRCCGQFSCPQVFLNRCVWGLGGFFLSFSLNTSVDLLDRRLCWVWVTISFLRIINYNPGSGVSFFKTTLWWLLYELNPCCWDFLNTRSCPEDFLWQCSPWGDCIRIIGLKHFIIQWVFGFRIPRIKKEPLWMSNSVIIKLNRIWLYVTNWHTLHR